MKKLSKNKKRILFTLIAVLIIVIVILLFRSCQNSPKEKQNQEKDSSSAIEKTLDFTPYADSESGNITLPAVTGLNFKANEKEQTVNFYNPDSNRVNFTMSLKLSDDTEIWRSDTLKPGDQIKSITLYQPLQKGLYANCSLVYECYDPETNQQLNGGKVKLEISSN